MARIAVKVHPRARRTAVAGRFGEAWKLDLAAPPVDGKANQECIRFLAGLAGVPQARVHIMTGAGARLKLVEVEGIEQAELERRLIG
jgi:uncharacterized protein YggU (UPF0235/DUF167 family)